MPQSELIIKYSVKEILHPISVWEDFREQVRWVIKHDMGFYVWKKRWVFHIIKMSWARAWKWEWAVWEGLMRRDCPKVQRSWLGVRRRLEMSMLNKYFLDTILVLGAYICRSEALSKSSYFFIQFAIKVITSFLVSMPLLWKCILPILL